MVSLSCQCLQQNQFADCQQLTEIKASRVLLRNDSNIYVQKRAESKGPKRPKTRLGVHFFTKPEYPHVWLPSILFHNSARGTFFLSLRLGLGWLLILSTHR